MYKEIINSVSLVGNISSIGEVKTSSNGKKYRFFDICLNNKYFDKNGEQQETKEYYSIKQNENTIDKYNSMLEVGKWVHIIGFLHTYIDKNKNKQFFVVLNSARNLEKQKESKDLDEIFDYDWLNDTEENQYEI